MADDERTRPDNVTRETEAEDARVRAASDDPPTKEEEDAAARAEPLDAEAAAAYKEALERGADQEGEGRIP